ncbi:diguanylate phosphodiesterase, partial [Pseudomonas syringae pv. tagetis]
LKPLKSISWLSRGAVVLLWLAQCINDRVVPCRDFVGHFGGDDFLLVLGFEEWDRRLNTLLDDFQNKCRRCCRAEPGEAGCFVALRR